MKRKIAAILAADIAGFSKLVAEDEEGALERLGHARDHFVTTIDQFGGRVFNEAGDSILAEFASAVDALRCAVEVQQHFRSLAREEPSESRMLYRIGLTIGDVVERDGNLLGDAVNVAARLESLAKPGGICVSRSVHEHVSGKIAVRFLSLGEQKLKNIPTKQHAWEVILPQKKPDKADTAARALDPPPISARAEGGPSPALKRMAAALVIVAAAGAAAWALPWASMRALIDKPASTAAAPSPALEPKSVATSPPVPSPAAPSAEATKTTVAVEQPVESKLGAPPVRVAEPPVARAVEPTIKTPEPQVPKAAEPQPKVASTAPIVPATPQPQPQKSGECSTFLPQTGTTISVPCPDAPAVAAPAKAATDTAKSIVKPAPATAESPTVVIALPTRRPADLAAPATPVVQPAAAAAEPAKAESVRAAPRRKGQHCAEILERAQLGELSIDDKEYLQRECR